jgi:hypothetical protein
LEAYLPLKRDNADPSLQDHPINVVKVSQNSQSGRYKPAWGSCLSQDPGLAKRCTPGVYHVKACLAWASLGFDILRPVFSITWSKWNQLFLGKKRHGRRLVLVIPSGTLC